MTAAISSCQRALMPRTTMLGRSLTPSRVSREPIILACIDATNEVVAGSTLSEHISRLAPGRWCTDSAQDTLGIAAARAAPGALRRVWRARERGWHRPTDPQTQTHRHAHTDTQTHRHTHTDTHTQTHRDTHTDTQTHRPTDTQTHSHTHINTHTHQFMDESALKWHVICG